MGMTLVTFVGLGKRGAEGEFVGYDSVQYALRGERSSPTRFVQTAICELAMEDTPERVLALCSPSARERTWPDLQAALERFGIPEIETIETGERLRPRELWGWFEELFSRMHGNERVVFDLTHGFRAYGIVLAAAADLLMQAKDVRIEGMYYGAIEADSETAELVDLRPFFSVAAWADAVRGLSRRMDAAGLLEVHDIAPRFQQPALKSTQLQTLVAEFAKAVRNVEANRIPEVAEKLSASLDKLGDNAGSIERHLLIQLKEFVRNLVCAESELRRPSPEYFRLQTRLIRLLLDHGMVVNAATIMRELIGSIGAVGVPDAGFTNEDARKRREWAAETFISTLSVAEEHWDFRTEGNPAKDAVVTAVIDDFYQMRERGITGELRELVGGIRELRNGFDHAWMRRKKAPEDADVRLHALLGRLVKVVERLVEEGFIT